MLGLPRPAWLLQLGFGVNAVGNGMVLPFLVIYLHNVRGFSIATAGLVASGFGLFSLLTMAPGGALADRVDSRRVLVLALALNALGYGLFPLVREPWHAVAFIAIAGAGNGLFWPANTSLLVAHTPAERRQVAFAVNRAVFNLGIGVGGLVAGLLASSSEPRTFTVLFLLDAGTFVAYAGLLAFVPSAHAPAAPRGGRYLTVLRDRSFMAVVALNAAFIVVAFAQLQTTFPAFAKNEVGLSERAIGLLYALNVFGVAAAQIPLARLVEGRRRMPVLAAMMGITACAWVLVLGSAAAGASAAIGVLVAAVLVFALGECLHAPAQGALVADLAVPELRGRYFALSAYSYAIGFTLGPALGGLLLDAAPDAFWGIAAAACLATGAAALALERHLPAEIRRTQPA